MKKLFLILLGLILFTRTCATRAGGDTPQFPSLSIRSAVTEGITPIITVLGSSDPVYVRLIDGKTDYLVSGQVTFGAIVGPYLHLSWQAADTDWFEVEWSTNLMEWHGSGLRFVGAGSMDRQIVEPFKFWRLRKTSGPA